VAGRRWAASSRRAALSRGGAAAVPLVAAACGAGGPAAGSPVQVSKPVSLIVWFPQPGQAGSENHAAFFQRETAAFQQANPQVRVTSEPAAGNDKLQAAVVAGVAPDMIQAGYASLFPWVKQGVVEPIDAYLDRRGKGDYYDWAREGSSQDGKMWQWPWLLNPTGVIANRSLFVEKNATNLLPRPGPKVDWTIDQWRSALRAVTTVSGDPARDIYGTAFTVNGTGGDYYQMMYLWSSGAELYNKEQTKVTLCVPEGYAALQMLVDLVHRDRVAAPGPEKVSYQNTLNDFLAKKMGILNGSINVAGEVERRLRDGSLPRPFEAQFFPVAHAPGKKPAAFVGINGLFVFRQPSDMDRTRAAMRFGYHLTDTPAQKTVAPIQSLPVRRSAGNIYPDDPNLTTALATVDNARDLGRFSTNGEVRQLWLGAIQAAFTQQQSPRAAMDEFCRLAEPVMARA
jgi:multiple sugar transport system substrate-binding protein